MTYRIRLVTSAVAMLGGPVWGETARPIEGIRARVQPASYQTPLGKPVHVVFTIENTSDEAITLTVPGTKPDIPSPEAGLPLSHVFSGADGTGVELSSASGRTWSSPLGLRRAEIAPIRVIAPHAVVGAAVNVRG